MSGLEKTEILKTFASFPPETKYGFAAGYAAAKAEEAAKEATENNTTEQQRPA